MTLDLLGQIEARLKQNGHAADFRKVRGAIARDLDKLVAPVAKARPAAKTTAKAPKTVPTRPSKQTRGNKKRPAAEVSQDRGDGELWLDHAVITDDDFARLKSCRRLSLWNVDVPDGFLARLPKLWWVDLREKEGLHPALDAHSVHLRRFSSSALDDGQVKIERDFREAARLARAVSNSFGAASPPRA